MEPQAPLSSPPRILLLGNNWVAWRVLEQLRAGGAELVGLVLHPDGSRRFGDELVAAAGENVPVLDGSRINEPDTVERIRALGPELGVSALFGYLLGPEVLGAFPRGVVNLHPSLLPYNRGQYPNVWSIVEGTPAGVTLHAIDAGLDTGPVLAQREVEVEPVDTGATLYRKLEEASVALFEDVWPALAAGELRPRPQASGGTYHRTRDVQAIDEIDLDRVYRAGDLIDVLRARTFPPYAGAFFRVDGRKVHLRLALAYDEDEGETAG